jgi:hypothetical protein
LIRSSRTGRFHRSLTLRHHHSRDQFLTSCSLLLLRHEPPLGHRHHQPLLSACHRRRSPFSASPAKAAAGALPEKNKRNVRACVCLTCVRVFCVQCKCAAQLSRTCVSRATCVTFVRLRGIMKCVWCCLLTFFAALSILRFSAAEPGVNPAD